MVKPLKRRIAPTKPPHRKPARARSPAPGSISSSELTDLRVTVLTRIRDAVQQVVSISPREQLYKALETKTPIDALIHLMGGTAVIAEVASRVEDPLRAARARAAGRMAALLASDGGPLGVEAVAELLRIGRAAVDKRRKAGTLIGVDDGGRRIEYPSWQFTATGMLPGLENALRAIGVSDPWMRMQFFLTTDPDLRSRPLDALRQGRIGEVIAAAGRHGYQGQDGERQPA